MYKEFREMSRTDAVEALYQDMAARHRARFGSIAVCSRFPRERTPEPVLTAIYRSSRSLRSRTPTASAAPTSSSCSARTSSSPCLTVPPRPAARSSSLTLVLLPSHRCERGVWGKECPTECAVNDCYGHSMHAGHRSRGIPTCIYRPRPGPDGYDVSCVLCSELKLYSKKYHGVLQFFSNVSM